MALCADRLRTLCDLFLGLRRRCHYRNRQPPIQCKLKKFGFGPVTIKAIRDYANKPEETESEENRPKPGEMSDRHRQELELQKQERAKNAEQSATDYLGTSAEAQKINENYVDPKTGKKPVSGNSNFLNTGGFGARPEKTKQEKPKYTPTAEEQALLDEAAELRKKVGSRNTAERTAAQKRLTEIQPQLNEIAKKKKAGGTTETASDLDAAYAEADGER